MNSTSASPAPKKMASKETAVPRPPKDEATNALVQQQASSDTWMILLAFRFINVLCVATFFQPDEYFQSLEPAWKMAFGSQSGAWITWVFIRSFGMKIISDNLTGMATSTPFLFASRIVCSCVLSLRQLYGSCELLPTVPSHDLVYSSKCCSGDLCCYGRLLYVATSGENIWNRKQVYFGSCELSKF
jgi:Alg9-like mannosyltransferase family